MSMCDIKSVMTILWSGIFLFELEGNVHLFLDDISGEFNPPILLNNTNQDVFSSVWKRFENIFHIGKWINDSDDNMKKSLYHYHSKNSFCFALF